MAGRRLVLMLLISLLASGAGLGGWSTPVPGLAQDTRDAAEAVVYQEPPQDVADVRVFYEPLAPYGTWMSLPEYGQVCMPHDMSPTWRPYTQGAGSTPVTAGHRSQSRSGAGRPFITDAGPSLPLTAGSGSLAPCGPLPGWSSVTRPVG
jgi:hypothetical protein